MTTLFQLSLAISVPLFLMWLSYRWALASEKQFALNRFLLLSIYVVSIAAAVTIVLTSPAAVEVIRVDASSSATSPETESINWTGILATVWVAGAVVVAIFTFVELLRVHTLVRRCTRVRFNGMTLFISDNPRQAPFSLGSSIIINRNDYESACEAIATHEQGHMSMHHSWDMVLAQFIIIVCWYNPAAWLMRSELKSVHEYQADCHVLRSGLNIRDYQLLLIKKAVCSKFPSIANNLNHSKLKKRIAMMNRPDGISRLRCVLYSLPAAAFLLGIVLLSTSPVQAVINPPKIAKVAKTSDSLENVDIRLDGETIDSNDLKAIDPHSIKSITVHKDPRSIDIETNN